MIDTQSLKNKILDLAIRGKLTRQLPDDGTAEELYEKIQEEKQALVEAGKIKKEKHLKEIEKDEVPFEIPGNWKWVRLSEICQQITDGAHKTPKYQKEGIPFLSVKNISAGYLDLSDIKFISEEEHMELSKRCNPQKDDVLVCRIGTLGKALIVDVNFDFSVFVSLGLIKTGSKQLSKYICSVINSGYGFEWIETNKAGGAMHTYKINLNDLNMMSFPLPPEDEVERILSKTEKLFSEIDTIEKLQTQYAADSEILKSKLIDAAIQGKLTEQLPSDGTAEELYQQIQTEKQALISAGKIKKEKPLKEIEEDEIPFEIPESWKWVYMGDIFQHNTGKALNSSEKEGELLEYITTSNMYWDHFELNKLKQMRFKPEEIEKCTITKGDLLVCEGGDIGRSAIWNYDYDMRIQNHIHRLRGYLKEKICEKFYYYVMWFYKHSGLINGRGIGLQGFSSKRLHSLVVPLPPFEEQKRIVGRLNELIEAIE